MIWLLIAIYLAIIYIEVPGLLREKMYRELGLFTVVLVLGIYLSLSQFYDWLLFNPFAPWIDVLMP
ncbi:MAG: hypothetical protein PHG94_09700 [Syntrophomonas sp.]|uniref:hypothetical protein n=1 Tax=Syntrophomonas sp. TaxID=2053627 RepID=UPI00260BDFC9|nr:hypothetical protein [Syntrophomonas sp.]MDD2511382.1 hypothetical protein [Syntrophomonas sp.]MDD4627363.1 hypothetical protein [Syntrophomonas sp.]